MRDAEPTRRAVLGAVLVLAAGAATGCTSSSNGAPGETPKQKHADDDLKARAATASADLADRYAAVVAAFPSLSGRLTPLAAEVQQHLAALGGRPAAPSPSASGAAPPVPSPTQSPLPTTSSAALADLAAREQDGVNDRTADLAGASGALARLLASVAACQAAHVSLLRN